MPTPSYLAQPQIQRIPVLLSELMNGLIRVPRFQRPFVWLDHQRLELFESIYEGFPIGTLMVWRTREYRLRTYDRLGPFRLVDPTADERPTVQYLFDGHQRMSTLYGALAEGLATTADENNTLELVDAESDDVATWPIYFDLQEQEFRLRPRVAEPPANLLPLDILLDPYKLHEFQRELMRAGFERRLVNRSEHLASTFKDYSIPVVPIVTNDLELVTTSFQRINTAGTTMSEVHMVSALAYREEQDEQLDLNERIDDMHEQLAEVGWQQLESKLILNVVKAAAGLDVYKAKPEQVRDRIWTAPTVLDDALEHVVEAATALRQWGVRGPNTLPYSYQIVILADAMRLCDNSPSDDLVDALRRWFWRTTYTEHFAGMNSTTLDHALAHVATLVDEPTATHVDDDIRIDPITRFDYRAARSRAWALRLAEREPHDVDGAPYDAFETLAVHGNDATFHLVPRKTGTNFGIAPENRIIAPPTKGPALARALRERPHELDDKTLHSHAITESVAAALRDEDHEAALAARRQELCEREMAFVERIGLRYDWSDAT